MLLDTRMPYDVIGCRDCVVRGIYSETFKMADALQASCAAPVFKRPRLEFSPCESDTLISYEPVSNEGRFSVDSGLQEDTYEVTFPSNCHADDHPEGGPSNPGFSSDVGVASGVLDQDSVPFENCIQSSFIASDSPSNMLAHEGFNGPHSQTEHEVDENDTEDQESTISPISWVQRQMISGMDPRLILGELLPKGAFIPHNVTDSILWRFIVNLLSEPKRTKLTHINTLDDAVNLLKTCKKIIILTGAGVSVSCGIPDFRSRNGIYARLSKDYPDLPDPQAMFDINYFRRDPRPFFKFAKEIYPGQFQPSPSHRFIKLLEKQNKLLRNYTQNIDTLEHAAGIKNVITCHGSFATATCTVCHYKVDSSVIKEDIFSQRIPFCPVCLPEVSERGIMKPDIVFFGEGLSDEFHEAMAQDKEICDLLIVIGSSLKVRPVAMIPSSIPTNVPQILINRERLKHLTFDIELLGDCDVIIGELCRRLEKHWEIEETIPGLLLKEIVVNQSVKRNVPPQNDAVYSESSSQLEVNNNLDSSHAETSDAPSSLPPSEESNSCDCRGLSAIKLDDSEDGSNQEQPVLEPTSNNECDLKPVNSLDSKNAWLTSNHEIISKRIPGQSYLFLPPSRYIFEGAEVYRNEEEEEEETCSTPTDYSSDCDSPKQPPLDLDSEVTLQNQFPLESSCQQSNDDKSEHEKESPNT